MNINDAFTSNYIKHSDLGGKRVVVTLERVEMETLGQGKDAEQKLVAYFRGKDKGLALNKTNAYTIAEITGSEDTDHWPGHRILLYPDKTQFNGKRVDCIRIAAAPAGAPPQRPTPPPPPVEEISDSFEGAEDEPPF